jgi:hypothetical protein
MALMLLCLTKLRIATAIRSYYTCILLHHVHQKNNSGNGLHQTQLCHKSLHQCSFIFVTVVPNRLLLLRVTIKCDKKGNTNLFGFITQLT